MIFNEVILVDGSKLYVNGAQTPIFKIKQIREDAFGVFITILPGRELQIRINGTTNFISRADANTALIAYLQLFDTGGDAGIFIVVSALPATGVANKIYLVPKGTPEAQNTYDEFIWVDSAWENLGTITLDLSNYYNKTEVNGLLSSKVDKNNAITAGTKTKITYDSKGLVTSGADLVVSDIPNLAISKITSLQATLDTIETSKQDKLVAGENITIVDNVISASGEVDFDAMAYFDYAGSFYGDKYSLLASAWEDMKEVDGAEIERESTPLTQYGTLQYPNGEDNGVIIPNSVTSIGSAAFYGWTANDQPLVIPNSVTSIGNTAFSSWSSNNHPLVIPNSVTSIGNTAFSSWSSNNHPLVIPNSVTSIGNTAFSSWSSNNHPLVIPNSVTSIGSFVFYGWKANTHPLIIPSSVTSIDSNAFDGWSLVQYVEIQAITPPTLASSSAFNNQNNAPIYVPDESVDAYKTATNWVALASRIFPISDRQDEVDGKITAHNTNSEAHQDIRGDIGDLKLDIQTIEQSVEKIPTIEQDILDLESDKVDKVSGMGLSSNDFTTTEKNKLSGIQAGAQVNEVTTVAGRTGAVVLAKADVGLGNVDNTSDGTKYVQGLRETRANVNTKIWTGTQAQYDAIVTKDATTLYFITE